MSGDVGERGGDPVRLAGLHALAFLVAGSAAGLVMAALLAWPRLGSAIVPLTYGRWAPVHLNATLYGWGALPLVALLLRFYGAGAHAPRLARLSVHAWSAALVAGCVSWLAGGSGGKAFLDWNAGSRVLLVAGMSVLSLALLAALVASRRELTRGALAARAALLALLAPVPFVLAWATRDDVRPPINPDSGGPTGVSLLGSVLGLVALLLLTPPLLGRVTAPARRLRILAVALGLHGAAFLALRAASEGHASHRDALQAGALASVAAWIPLLAWGFRDRAIEWPARARAWLAGSAAWGLLLAASGLVAFAPGVLERWKFSHALVAHAHVALAGLVTSWNALALVSLLPGPAGAALASRRRAWAWHASLGLHVAALAGLAVLEQRSPGGLLPASDGVQALLVLRAAAGLLQLAVAGTWLLDAMRAERAALVQAPEPAAAAAAVHEDVGRAVPA